MLAVVKSVDNYDYLVVGGGIVGISTAWQLKRRCPTARVLLLDKEPRVASHQSGHNSGVVHAGIYYPPGSLKAQFCQRGAAATIDFCRQHKIAYQRCGKLLVATTVVEVERMQSLYQRALGHDVPVELLDSAQLRRQAPNVTGLGAIWVPSTAIVDYRQVAASMLQSFRQLGGEVALGTTVIDALESDREITLITRSEGRRGRLRGNFMIACCGLMADRMVTLLGIQTDFRIVPFRGEYYRLPAKYNDIVAHLIYPIPDPKLPFLGIHLTRMIDGSVTVGPNATLGWKREGYGKFNIDARDIKEMLEFPGFWRAMGRHLGTGLAETKNSWWRPGYLQQVRKYCPQINLPDLLPYPAGVRAQAVMRDGTLADDFLFARSPRSLHVCNAPSPAATAAIPIGEYIGDQVLAP